MYGFNILVFSTLTSIHPFDGFYNNLDIYARMKMGISVLGEKKVVIPSIIPHWDWMTDRLKESFLDVFERGLTNDIVSELKFQITAISYCPWCKKYYIRKKGCKTCQTEKIVIYSKENLLYKSPEYLAANEVGSVELISYVPYARQVLSDNFYIDESYNLVNTSKGIKCSLSQMLSADVDWEVLC